MTNKNKRTNSISKNNILDVTLRDGGYLNDWKFSWSEIVNVLNFLHQQGLCKVEIGFLRTPERGTSLVNACPSEFLVKLNRLYPDVSFICMLNPAEGDWQAAVANKLPYISLIRIPCVADQVQCALEIANGLHEQCSDIQVSLNLICISSYSLDEIEALLNTIAPSNSVDIVYLADSRGALHPHEVDSIVSLAREICPQSLGFHAHDTQGKAIENSDRAFACGCDWIDVTLNGYGLAGGNTPLGSYLAHHDLLPPHTIQADVTDFCKNHLSLAHPEQRIRQLYRVLAQKNIDPVWHNKLEEKYLDNLHPLVEKLPRKHYKTLESVLEALNK